MIIKRIKLKILNNNKIFYFLLLVVISISTFLNYKAEVMGPMVVLYEDYATFFSQHFDLSVPFKYSQYTFPMWGYGLVLLFLKKKYLVIIFQQIITYLTVIYFEYSFSDFLKYKKLFRFLLLISFPWYFFHTSIWPYSLGSNLLIIGIVSIFNYQKSNNKYLLFFSGFCFGIMLNLRSDYYYLILILFVFLLIYEGLKKKIKAILWITLWFSIIQTLLIPWGYYTYKRTGHYLQTSTNAGHVFFISLGQLPNNKWKITQEDNDSVMYTELRNHFPQKTPNSLAYEENKYLMKKWKDLVLESPTEYIKKCLFNCYRIFRTPFYIGNLETLTDIDNVNKNIIKEKLKKLLDNGKFIEIIRFLFFERGSIYLTTFFLNIFSISFFFVFIFYFIRSIFYKCVINDFLSLIILILIFYQNLMSIFVFYMPIYNSNLYLIYLLGIFYFQSKVLYKSKL